MLNTDGELTVVAVHYEHAKATSLAAGSPGSAAVHSAPTGENPGLTFMGTFGGAMGEYSCSGADCSVTLNDKGVVTMLDGDPWTFDPAANTKLKLPDTDYLHFGWWIDSPAMADGTYGFQTFAGGTPEYTANYAPIEGPATYKGAAAGVYVTKDVSAGLVTGANMGEFTAKATLEANFGDEMEAGNIDGSIHDFMDADGTAMAGWGVTLRNVNLGTSGTFAGETRGTTGPGTSGTGSWEGTFYGVSDEDAVPTGVAGRFDAHLPGAHIVGAYGASK